MQIISRFLCKMVWVWVWAYSFMLISNPCNNYAQEIPMKHSQKQLSKKQLNQKQPSKTENQPARQRSNPQEPQKSIIDDEPEDTADMSLEAEAGNDQYINVDFNNVDIQVFIKYMSEITKKNFILDQRVKGKITVISPSKIPVVDALDIFESVLEVYGYATVSVGDVIKVIPAPDIRTKNIETRLMEESTQLNDRVVTQLIPLTYADVEEVKRLFAALVSKSSVVLSYNPTNTLIITDVASNIDRLWTIIKAIDVQDIGRKLSIFPLSNADSVKLSQIVSSMFIEQEKAKSPKQESMTKIIPDERTNSLIVLANEVESQKIKQLIELLDKEMPKPKEKIHVYYLEHATAEEMAKVLQTIPSSESAAPGADKAKPTTPVMSQKAKIYADKATNSLIIMAEKEDYKVLEEVIKKLDIPRSMVYIECLIMEVNMDRSFHIGTEWRAGIDSTIDGKAAVYGTGFGGGSETGFPIVKSMLDPTKSSGFGMLLEGFSIGAFGEGVTIGGLHFPNLAAVIQTYAKDKDVNILSTPQILTTDNVEASIAVGKNIPYQTKSGVTSSLETYNNYDYKDVGIMLKVTPHINKDRMIRLDISQEVNKLDQLATGSTQGDRPTTLSRKFNTTVIVKDKRTIVIGGLIDDSFTDTQYKIPCLGDIPVLGWLFKSLLKSREKTNLLVFLTPHVIESPEESETLSTEKKASIDAIKEGIIPLNHKQSDGIIIEHK
ncbi:MAG: type II secretion system secretin GspD [Desulfobacterales bacterium]|nr:type II secretion system secretin GspD [Desulfobacterales bacterium]